jgi:hypothetical protein
MTRPESLEAIHRALRSQGIDDRAVHEYLDGAIERARDDWIEDSVARDWRPWWLLAAGMGLLGLIAGAAVCWLVQ